MAELEYDFITEAHLLPQLAQRLADAPDYGYDVEATSLDPRLGEFRLAQYNIGGKIYVVDLFKTGGHGVLLDGMRDCKGVSTIHQATFEQKWHLFKHKFVFPRPFCTWRASNIVDNGREELSHGLWDLEKRYLNVEHDTTEDMQRSDWSGELTPRQILYAAKDVQWLPDLRVKLKDRIVKEGLIDTATLEFGVIPVEVDVELTGLGFNKAKWLALAEENEVQADILRDQLLRELPTPLSGEQTTMFGLAPNWNLDSSQQLIKSLRKLGMKQKDTTFDEETHKPHTKIVPIHETNEEVLAQCAGEFPICAKIIKYRGHRQRVKTFGPQWLEHVNKQDGRVHTHFWPFTGAGRYSTSNPNTGNIPRDKEYRACFEAPPGRVMVLSDFSGVEMVILAEVTQDPELIRVFRNDIDIHKNTASIVMAKAITELTKEDRQNAKPVNFGFAYGMGWMRFGIYALMNYGVVVNDAQSKLFRERYFERYSGVDRWHKRALRDGQRLGYTRTLGGRIRYLPSTSRNEFFNTPVQGTGADSLKRALRDVWNQLQNHPGNPRVCHHVYDEIIVECDDDPEVIASVKKILQTAMIASLSRYVKAVPVKADPSHGKNWSEAK